MVGTENLLKSDNLFKWTLNPVTYNNVTNMLYYSLRKMPVSHFLILENKSFNMTLLFMPNNIFWRSIGVVLTWFGT